MSYTATAGTKLAITTLLILGCTASAPQLQAQETLPGWSEGATSLEDALQAQRDDGAPVALYFYTDWCGYCKRLNRAVSGGGLELDGFLKVRINPEKGAAEHALAQRYGIRGYPSVFVLPARSNQARQIQTHGEWTPHNVRAFEQACRAAAGAKVAPEDAKQQAEESDPYGLDEYDSYGLDDAAPYDADATGTGGAGQSEEEAVPDDEEPYDIGHSDPYAPEVD
jgi:thiol-disulfide isomerase/thioredoxin